MTARITPDCFGRRTIRTQDLKLFPDFSRFLEFRSQESKNAPKPAVLPSLGHAGVENMVHPEKIIPVFAATDAATAVETQYECLGFQSVSAVAVCH